MKYLINIKDKKQLPNIEAALKIIDHDTEIVSDVQSSTDIDLELAVSYTPDFHVKVWAPGLSGSEKEWEYYDREIQDRRYNESDRKQRLKELIRLGIINVTGKHFGKKPPWGILSGVRPTKIYHYLRDKGFTNTEIRDKLLQIFGLAQRKADLLLEVGSLQEKYFTDSSKIGVYIGIPFCPTRCRYCSFAAVSLETHRHLVKNFLTALEQEIEAMSSLRAEYGWQVESIYLGGGTPSSLEEEAFSRLLDLLTQAFFTPSTVEYTVEAGRPETISKGKLLAMSRNGVNRISINPQTMEESTLKAIGRRHSISDIYEAVAMVRQFPELLLNMDLILGLPGENSSIFLESLQKIMALQPENITIHTLAPKRAATWRKNFTELELSQSLDLTEGMERAIGLLANDQYQPYYLYRQRLILADLENVGFAKPKQESVYNIQMMEERQTILGLGGGAVTKWVIGPEHQVYRHQNPKCPATYGKRLEAEIVKKVQQTRLLLG
ncbi:MAG: coproporphyrinogen dehydrogenase HemZ [Bacteroidota bacterium]